MKKIVDNLGAGSIGVLAVTLVLFVVALFVKGLTKEILIETAAFLISVKIIMATYRNTLESREIMVRLRSIERMLQNTEARQNDSAIE